MKKTKFKQNLSRTIKEIGNGSKIRGITLISLVITIVILLILASVTIVLLKNSNILNNSKRASQKWKDAEVKETNILNEYSEKLADITIVKRNIDVLKTIKESGKPTSEFFTINAPSNQFSKSWLADQTLNGDLFYGHWEGYGTYIATYKLDCSILNFKKMKKLSTEFYHYRDLSSSTAYTFVQVFYKDSTSSEKKASTKVSDERWTKNIDSGTEEAKYKAELDIDDHKDIDYIQFTITGYDAGGGAYYAGIKDIKIFEAY